MHARTPSPQPAFLRPSPQLRTTRGFTLIELLTVIAIIGILAAIIIPTVSRVRRSAQAAACASNLRQIGAAMFLYAQANKQKLPPARDDNYSTWHEKMWQWQLRPYLEGKHQVVTLDAVHGGIFRCPGKPNYNIDGPTDRERVSYAMNSFGNGGDDVVQRSLSSLRQPSITLLVTDTNTTSYRMRNSAYLYTNVEDIALWHSQKNNTLFADGHVEAVPRNGVNTYLMKTTDGSVRP